MKELKPLVRSISGSECRPTAEAHIGQQLSFPIFSTVEEYENIENHPKDMIITTQFYLLYQRICMCIQTHYFITY